MSRRARAINPRFNLLTEMDPERRNALALVAGIGAIVVLALGLVVYGYYTDRIAPAHGTVLTVGDRDFDVALLERRAKADFTEGKIKLDSDEVLAIGIRQTLFNIEREELVRQAALAGNVTVTAEEIDNAIKARLRVPVNSPRERFAAFLQSELLRLGLPLEEYLELTRATLLEDKLRAQFLTTVPLSGEHADLRLIQFLNREKAEEGKQRLAAGETPAAVAARLSVHASRSTAGEIGWTPRGALPNKVDEVAFSQPFGLSDIIEEPEGFFMVETRAKEVRDLSDNAKSQVAEHSLTNLLQQTRDQVGADTKLTVGQLTRVARAIVQRLG